MNSKMDPMGRAIADYFKTEYKQRIMKSFGSKPWILPQPVLIIITYDPVHHTYIQLGKTVGKAFSDGKQLK